MECMLVLCCSWFYVFFFFFLVFLLYVFSSTGYDFFGATILFFCICKMYIHTKTLSLSLYIHNICLSRRFGNFGFFGKKMYMSYSTVDFILFSKISLCRSLSQCFYFISFSVLCWMPRVTLKKILLLIILFQAFSVFFS